MTTGDHPRGTQNLSEGEVLVKADSRVVAMARYFFDVDDGITVQMDDLGIDLAGPGSLPREAFNLLRLMVHDRMPEGRHTFSVQVRDETGAIAYRGEMTVDGRRFRP